MFLLIPTSGLGNRLRVIASSIKYQQTTGEKVSVLWIRDSGLNCRFDYLFRPIPCVRDCGHFFIIVFRFFRLLKKVFPKLKYVYALTDYQYNELKNYISQEGEKKAFLIAQSFSEFCNTEDLDYRVLFRPSEKVYERIKEMTSAFQGRETIGLHIRRTDNAKSIEESPLEAFEQRISEIISKNKNALFFLATDDESTEFHLSSKFGQNIVIPTGPKNRDTEDGILQAVAELYTLASCKYIIGSYYSSFSELAARLGNKRLEIIRR